MPETSRRGDEDEDGVNDADVDGVVDAKRGIRRRHGKARSRPESSSVSSSSVFGGRRRRRRHCGGEYCSWCGDSW
jgi:hypothetical protein